MTTAILHFHHPLQLLLRTRDKDQLQKIEFREQQSIKHLVESLGVPHTEVGQLQVGNQEIGFGYLVKQDDQVQVYPAAVECDNLSGMFNIGRLTIPARFILDTHLGKLATDLRMLGIDAAYSNQYKDQELAALAVDQNRILLTRDRQLLMRKTVRYGYLLRSLEPDEQLREVLERFNLNIKIQLFKRCMRCNHPLVPVDKRKIENRLEELTKKYFDEFHMCPECQQIYWPGSHVDRMQKRLAGILT